MHLIKRCRGLPCNPTLAFDKSMRSIDADGHMRVEESRISKANVCPYKGSEIPQWRELGLDPNKVYRLFRDPVELQKGAATFDGKPLLIRHVGIDADVPRKELWVGTVGKCTFEAPYLVTRPLMVLTKEAIELIENEEQRELSAAYRYEAQMTPGVYGGESYDGRMVNIRGNHVAIVSEGRAGHDVHVADAKPPELRTMKQLEVLTKIGQMLRPGATVTRAALLMALDAALGETPARSVMSLDESEKKAAEDRARDAKRRRGSDEELTEAEKEEAYDEARDEKEEAHDSKEAAEDEREEKEDEGKEEAEAKDRKRARDARRHARDSRRGARDKRAKDRKAAHDAAAKHVAQNMDKRGKDAAPDPKDHRQDFRSEDSVTKDEMNAAIKVAIDQTRARERAAAAAREAVRPVVGAVDLAMDSAESIYKFALERSGVELAGVPEAAYAALFAAVRKNSSPAPRPLAMDASGAPLDLKSMLGLPH